jgi:hypothetical protein
MFREGRAASNRTRAEAGYQHHPLRNIHSTLVRRCLYPSHKDYPRYGGRGIGFYEPWRNRGRFIEDVEREIGPRPSLQHSIDRIDNNGNYEPGNIRWATALSQRHNQRLQFRLLTAEDATAIRRRYAAEGNGFHGSAHTGVTQADLAAEYGVSQNAISKVVNRRGRYATLGD